MRASRLIALAAVCGLGIASGISPAEANRASRDPAHNLKNRVWGFFSEGCLARPENRVQAGESTSANRVAPTTFALGCALGFQAHLMDYDADLIHMRARVFDPHTGLFLQRDPSGYADSVNLYAGFAWDTVNRRDPTGRIAPVIWGAAIGLLVLLQDDTDQTSRVNAMAKEAEQQAVDALNMAASGVRLANEAQFCQSCGYEDPSELEGPAKVLMVGGGLLAADAVAGHPAALGASALIGMAPGVRVGLPKFRNVRFSRTVPHGRARPWPSNAGAINLNSNSARSNFGIYEIEVRGSLYKIGKADLNRVTQSSGLPTRLHQQVRKLRKVHGRQNVTARVVDDLGDVTTLEAKKAEEARLRAVYRATGKVPKGNEKSFKP